MSRTDSRTDLKEISCLLKHPVFLKYPDLTNALSNKLSSSCDVITGCQVIEVILDKPSSSIQCISFRNYYTHTVTILALLNHQSDTWEACIKDRQLMPACHYEHGGQDWCVIEEEEFMKPLVNVKTLRLVLKQPSPNWNKFGIQNFSCYSIQ